MIFMKAAIRLETEVEAAFLCALGIKFEKKPGAKVRRGLHYNFKIYPFMLICGYL